MELLLLPKYDTLAASGRLRFYQFVPYYELAGFTVHVSPLFDNRYLYALFNSRRTAITDIIRCYWRRITTVLGVKKNCIAVIHCESTPYLPNILEWWLSFRGIPYIYDFDDAIFHNYDEHNNVLIRTIYKQKIARIIRNASHIFAGSDYLCRYARAYNNGVSLVPTVVDIDRYGVKDYDQAVVERFTIGWVGSPSTTHYVESVIDVLRHFCVQHHARLVLVGARPLATEDPNVEVRPWQEDTEAQEIQRFDVGIMPLLDESWARGKCGYKLIQYMACGIPVVASPIGENSRIVENGKNGYLASTAEEWFRALETLLFDRELRRALGMAGREKVEKCYSLQYLAPKLIGFINQIGNEFQNQESL